MLIEECIKRKIDLDWWGLFNSGISTKLDILKKAISCSHIKFYPFAEYFHPKVIHFHNYGIYIGSHNMTNSAMYKNIEAGVFIDENDLSDEHWHEINDLFDYLKDHSVPATQEDIDKIDEYIELTKIENEKREEIDTGLEELFEEQFKHLFILKSGVTDYGKEEKRDKENKRKLLFLQEWRECQNYLFIVQKYIIEKCQQPKWINPSAPMTIITDQLLHAYYYSYILKNSEEHKNIEAVNNAYHSNKRDPENAILTAIRWWETLDKALNNEDIPINEWGISNREILSKIQERDLTENGIKQVMLHNQRRQKSCARQIKNKTFDLPDSYSTDEDERVKIYVSWSMKKNESNLSVNDTIRYLLFNDQYRVEERSI